MQVSLLYDSRSKILLCILHNVDLFDHYNPRVQSVYPYNLIRIDLIFFASSGKYC